MNFIYPQLRSKVDRKGTFSGRREIIVASSYTWKSTEYEWQVPACRTSTHPLLVLRSAKWKQLEADQTWVQCSRRMCTWVKSYSLRHSPLATARVWLCVSLGRVSGLLLVSLNPLLFGTSEACTGVAENGYGEWVTVKCTLLQLQYFSLRLNQCFSL